MMSKCGGTIRYPYMLSSYVYVSGTIRQIFVQHVLPRKRKYGVSMEPFNPDGIETNITARLRLGGKPSRFPHAPTGIERKGGRE